MPSAHFKCVNRLGLVGVDAKANQYTSEAWDISITDAEQLVGGMIYFHETKNEPSYFGGRINSFDIIEIDAARSKRIRFHLTAVREGKGAYWKGRDDVMAHYSGVVRE